MISLCLPALCIVRFQFALCLQFAHDAAIAGRFVPALFTLQLTLLRSVGQMKLAGQRLRTNTHLETVKQSVDTARARVAFKNNGKELQPKLC